MGKNFEVGFISSVNPPSRLTMRESFLAAIEAIKPAKDMELILFVLHNHNLMEENVSMRFSQIAYSLADQAMQHLIEEGSPHWETYATVQSLFLDLCSSWITEQSFGPKKQEFVNLTTAWLVKEKEITGHVINGRQDPLWMLAKAIDLCFSFDLTKQIEGVQKYLEAIAYRDDWIAERAIAEKQIIESVCDLFEPELGNCFGRKED